MKRHRLSALAESDIVAGYRYYLNEAGPDPADRFLLSVEDSLLHIEAHPGTGSPRYEDLLVRNGLRFWTLDRFPYAVFYIEREDFIEVIRVLHQASDIPAHLEPDRGPS